MADDWCPENDGAYRAEMATLHRDNVDQQLLRARAEIERLRRQAETLKEGWRISDEGRIEAESENERLRAALGDVIDCNHHNFYDGGCPKYVRIARDALAQEDASP